MSNLDNEKPKLEIVKGGKKPRITVFARYHLERLPPLAVMIRQARSRQPVVDVTEEILGQNAIVVDATPRAPLGPPLRVETNEPPQD